MSIPKQLSEMAEALIADAMSKDSKMTAKEKVDIFKAASAWYLGVRKARQKDGDDPGDGSETFEALRERINGNGAIQ